LIIYYYHTSHGKYGVKVFKNLARCKSENNVLDQYIYLDHQNNYVGRLSVDNNATKSFNILINQFERPT